MNDIQVIIESGILDLYVLGAATQEEIVRVEQLALSFPEIRNEIDLIKNSISNLALIGENKPSPTVKPFLFASLDYKERMENGETLASPPVLNPASTISDFNEWLSRDDMQLAENFKDYYIKIISYTPAMSCAIVWIEHEAPNEVHHDEFEKLLIVEGSCKITYGNQIKELYPGDYFDVPRHEDHRVLITSQIPCKVILQRIAA